MPVLKFTAFPIGEDDEGVPQYVHLDPKQKLMAQYIADGNTNTQSRILAGYPDKSFGLEGPEQKKGARANVDYAAKMIAKFPDIQRYASYLRNIRQQTLSLQLDDLLKCSAAIIQLDIARLFTYNGDPLPVHEIDPATRASIKKIKITKKEDSTLYEYEFYDKIQAITMLTKLTDLAGDKMKAKLTEKKVTMQRFDE